MKNFFIIIAVLVIICSSHVLAQVPAPQIPLTGTLGTGGTFPLFNSGTLNFSTDADHTMIYPEMSAVFLKVTSAVPLTSTRKLIAPLNIGFQFTIENATTGGQSITVIGASGTGVTIPNGEIVSVSSDGTNYYGAPLSDYCALTGCTITGNLIDTGHSAFGANSSVDYTFPNVYGGTGGSVISVYETSTSADGLNGVISEIDWTPNGSLNSGDPIGITGLVSINADGTSGHTIGGVAGAFEIYSTGNTVSTNSTTIEAINQLIGNASSASQNGVYSRVINGGSGTLSIANPLFAGCTNYGPGAITNCIGVSSMAPDNGIGSVTNWKGFYATQGDALGSSTNAYGFYYDGGISATTLSEGMYIGPVTGAATNYQIYSAGTAPSYFAGPIKDVSHSSFGAESSVDYAFPNITQGAVSNLKSVESIYETSTDPVGNVGATTAEFDWSPSAPIGAWNGYVYQGQFMLNLDNSTTQHAYASYPYQFFQNNTSNTVAANDMLNIYSYNLLSGNSGSSYMQGIVSDVYNGGSGTVDQASTYVSNCGNSGTGSITTCLDYLAYSPTIESGTMGTWTGFDVIGYGVGHASTVIGVGIESNMATGLVSTWAIKSNTTAPSQFAGIINSANTSVLTSNETTASATMATLTLALATVPVSTSKTGSCDLLWQTSNTSGTVILGLNTSAASTAFQIQGSTYYPTTTTVQNTLPSGVVTTATTTPATDLMTAAAPSTKYNTHVDFSLQTDSTHPETITVYGDITGGYTLTLLANSSCSWAP